MARTWRIVVAFAMVGIIGLVAYTGYIGYEGSRRLVERDGTSRDCRTPDVQYGWAYEAINYDIADDAELRARNDDLRDCAYEGTPAGDEVVTVDGVRIAGWYIPAANGAGPTAPTVVAIHGFKANKSGILKYTIGLHEDFNLVVYDARNAGRSTGTQTTGGVLEQNDLRAILDWLERTKRPDRIGVLGNSLGAATALAEVREDERVDALALDSMHTRIGYQLEARVDAEYFAYFGTTWAIVSGTWLRTGTDLASIDAEDTIEGYGMRPLLLIHGTADDEDLPERTEAFAEHARSLGIATELHWCPGSGHNAAAGMPAEVCANDFAAWTSQFFAEALR
ncbi:MAG TPA: alpha/beta hydrolase [Candidatus Limnocylindria bacterium]